MNRLLQIGVMRFTFLMLWVSLADAIVISTGSRGKTSIRHGVRQSTKGRRGPDEAPENEPSETQMKLQVTQTSKFFVSLLSKFRVCGHESLIRMGPTRDGGYAIPSWPDTGNMGTIFSIGIRDDDPISHALSDKFGVPAHLYDCYSGPSPCPADLTRCNVTFHRDCAGGQDTVMQGKTFQTIQSMVQQHAPGSADNLILKIDCEGCEWDAFDALPVATLNRFKFLLTEMHWLEREVNHEKYLRVMTKLTQNFALVHRHGCNCFGQVHLSCSTVLCARLTGIAGEFNIPKIVEATFIRKDLLTSPQDCSVEANQWNGQTVQTGLDVPVCPANRELHDDAFQLPSA